MSARLAPRPGAHRGGMTRVGAKRDTYNATVEGRPPRWVAGEWNPAYDEWCARADAHQALAA